MRKPRLLLAVAGALFATVAVAAPAGAHAGGRIQLFLKDLKVEAGDGGYNLTALLVDRDSGEVATGFSTTAQGTSADGRTFPESRMTAESGGVYRLSVPADPGDWTVTLRSVAVPGTDEAQPLADQKRITFPVPGAAPAPATPGAGEEATAGTGGDGGGGSGGVIALIVVVALAGVGGVFFAKRRRPSPAL